jgi:hypothetical protein
MTANEAKQASDKARANVIGSIGPRIYSRIQDASSNGKKYLLCRSNKQTCQQLKSDGFGVIFLLTITLIRW